MSLVEKASNLFCICVDDKVLYMNSAGLALLEATSNEDVIGRELIDFIHGDYKEFLSYGLEMLAEEGDFIPLKLSTLKGAALDAKLLINPLPLGDQDGYIIEVQDITEYKRASEAVRDREHRLQSILNTVTEGILTSNSAGLVQTFNPAAEKIFGVSSQEIIGRSFAELMPENLKEQYQKFFEKNISKKGSLLLGKPLEFTANHKENGDFPVEMSITRVQAGKDFIYTAVCRDITERKQIEEKIRHLAHHDSLTGLPNRTLFTDRLQHAIKIATRYHKTMVLMFVDLDKFKPINDTLGHEAGDIVLKEVARRFRSLIRESDTVARIGGDEFIFLLEEIDSAEAGLIVAQKLVDCFKTPISVAGKECFLGSSIGLSCFPEDSTDADELMRFADEAMYDVKTSGRNGFKAYEGSPSIV